MKILATSSAGNNWTKEFICKECNSKLEVATEDLFVRNDAVAYAGETWDPNVYFKCPVCLSLRFVTNDIPSGLRHQLISKAASRH